MDQLPRLGRGLICLLSFTCNYVVSVRRVFLFLMDMMMMMMTIGSWDGPLYFIVALPRPSIYNFVSYS